MTLTSITPVLSSSQSYLEDVRDQVMSLVRFAVMNPGHISDYWDDSLISCRLIAAEHEHDRDYFVNVLNKRFNNLFSKKFKDCSVTANFTSTTFNDKGDDGRFSVNFDIQISIANTEEGGIIRGSISIDPNTYDIRLKFDNSIDSKSI